MESSEKPDLPSLAAKYQELAIIYEEMDTLHGEMMRIKDEIRKIERAVMTHRGKGRPKGTYVRDSHSTRVKSLLDSTVGRYWTGPDIADELGLLRSSVRSTLRWLCSNGRIARVGRGFYSSKHAAGEERTEMPAASKLAEQRILRRIDADPGKVWKWAVLTDTPDSAVMANAIKELVRQGKITKVSRGLYTSLQNTGVQMRPKRKRQDYRREVVTLKY